MISFFDISQVLIILLDALSVWFISRTEKWKRWGFIFGFAGQPFWLYTSLKNNQWGISLLSIFYMYAFGMGIYNYWFKKKLNKNILNDK